MPFRRRHRLYGSFALYGGRVEADNGSQEMLDYFDGYAEATETPLQLVLMGMKMMRVRETPGIRLAGMFVAMAFIFAQHPLYHGFYGDRALKHGITPVTDQSIAGGMMIGVDFVTVFAALFFFFWRSADDAEREELEQAATRLPTASDVKLGSLSNG